MAFSIPCDACRIPLRGRVVTFRVSTYAVGTGVPGGARVVPVERPQDYLFCTACAETFDAYVRLLAHHGGVPETAAG
jgi:hypothetical protein